MNATTGDKQTMNIGDRVYVDYEGLGTITEITIDHIAVKIDSDGVEVLCAHGQVHEVNQ